MRTLPESYWQSETDADTWMEPELDGHIQWYRDKIAQEEKRVYSAKFPQKYASAFMASLRQYRHEFLELRKLKRPTSLTWTAWRLWPSKYLDD